MPDISRFTLPSGNVYNLKDAQAREDIEEIRASISGRSFLLGTTTSEMYDGAMTNPVMIYDEEVLAQNGNMVVQGSKEYIFDGSVWHEFGDLGALGLLASKDSVSTNYTPTGVITTPEITVNMSKKSINNVTDAGTLPSCTLPTFSATVVNENLTIAWGAGSFNAGALPTLESDVSVATDVQSATATQPAFTGTQTTIVST